ncbi:hypothetical protein HRbin11_00626 [bacterium HR11]|nr:hypothetical protein HRbin11_00626 [bacterium HR11]
MESGAPLRQVLRNTLWNIGGQVFSFLVQFVTLPWIVHGVGVAAFGVWGLIGVLLSYFAFLDLSLRLAVVRFVSQGMTREDAAGVRQAVWSAVWILGLQSLAGLVVLILLTRPLFQHVFAIPAGWYRVAAWVFWVRAAGFLLELMTGLFRAVPVALQRMDRVIRRTALLTFIQSVGLAGMAQLGWGLLRMATWVLLMQVVSLGVFYRLALRMVPDLRLPAWDKATARSLLRFGGWSTVSYLVEPVLLHTEKLLIGRWAGVAQLTYYVVPYQLVTRLWSVTTGFSTALLPALSETDARRDQVAQQDLTLQSIRIISGVMAWPVLLMVVFARPLLTFWMGREFAERGTIPLQVLAVGLWINVINWPVFALFQAKGRPDRPALYHLGEACVYVPLAYVGVRVLGLPGAALAWTLRMALDSYLLLRGSVRAGFLPARGLGSALANPLAVTALLAGLSLGALQTWTARPAFVLTATAGWLVLGAYTFWNRVLPPQERRQFLRFWTRWFEA